MGADARTAVAPEKYGAHLTDGANCVQSVSTERWLGASTDPMVPTVRPGGRAPRVFHDRRGADAAPVIATRASVRHMASDSRDQAEAEPEDGDALQFAVHVDGLGLGNRGVWQGGWARFAGFPGKPWLSGRPQYGHLPFFVPRKRDPACILGT